MNALPPTSPDLQAQLRSAAGKLAEPVPSAALTGRVLAQIRAEHSPARPRRSLSPRLVLASVPALLLLIGLAWHIRRPDPAPDSLAGSPIQAINLSAWTEGASKWPQVLDRASDPYRQEWRAVREDATTSGAFLLELVSTLPGVSEAL